MKVHIEILYDTDTKEVRVEGPWEDGVLFMGMLEHARLAYTHSYIMGQQQSRAKASKILVPQLNPWPGVKKLE